MKHRFFLLSLTSVLTITAIFLVFQESTPWVAPPDADKLVNPYAGHKATAKGENLFSTNCERCHGNTGKGDGVDGKKLNPKPADLTSEKVQKQTDGAIFWKISNGRGPMDAYKSILQEDDRWKLVNYIRELGTNRNLSLK